MPLKLTVGLSKKMGLADFGSLGASCHIEFDTDESLLPDQLESFHRQVRNAYVVCAKAVNDELARHRAENNAPPSAAMDHSAPAPRPNGSPKSNGNGNHPASEKQLSYARQLAGKIQGLGIARLGSVAQNLFGKPLPDLSSHEASKLIDRLKSVQDKRTPLDAVLSGGRNEH